MERLNVRIKRSGYVLVSGYLDCFFINFLCNVDIRRSVVIGLTFFRRSKSHKLARFSTTFVVRVGINNIPKHFLSSSLLHINAQFST